MSDAMLLQVARDTARSNLRRVQGAKSDQKTLEDFKRRFAELRAVALEFAANELAATGEAGTASAIILLRQLAADNLPTSLEQETVTP